VLPSVPICDDDFCAIGEAELCPSAVACKPSGGSCVEPPPNRASGALCGGPGIGRCLAERSGTSGNSCECELGYTGADCSECAVGYEVTPAPPSWGWGEMGQICRALPPATFRDAPMSSPGVGEGKGKKRGRAQLHPAAIAGIALAVCTLPVLAIAGLAFWHRYQRLHAYDLTSLLDSAQETPRPPQQMLHSPVYEWTWRNRPSSNDSVSLHVHSPAGIMQDERLASGGTGANLFTDGGTCDFYTSDLGREHRASETSETQRVSAWTTAVDVEGDTIVQGGWDFAQDGGSEPAGMNLDT
jgi:hypothetical protein